MKWLRIAYDTAWFRCHPFTGDPSGRGLYMTWRTAWDVARIGR